MDGLNKAALLRTIRKELGISQAELAKASGLSQASISGFERGDHNLAHETIERIWAAIQSIHALRHVKACSYWRTFNFRMELVA